MMYCFELQACLLQCCATFCYARNNTGSRISGSAEAFCRFDASVYASAKGRRGMKEQVMGKRGWKERVMGKRGWKEHVMGMKEHG
jgi:hypothetical protein